MGACASFGLGRGGHLAGSVGLPGVRGRLRRKPGRFCHPQRAAPSRITGDTHGRVLELTASRLPRRNLIRRWSVGFSEESQKDCLYFSNDKCCPLCKKQAELALFMRKCEISNKDLLFLLGPVWVQAELGPALGRRAGEARTMGRCWPVPYARMVFAWGTWTGFWDVWRRGSFLMPLSVRGGPTLAEERTAECVPGVRGLVLPHPGVGQSPIALPVPAWDPLSHSLPRPLLRGKDLKDKEMF